MCVVMEGSCSGARKYLTIKSAVEQRAISATNGCADYRIPSVLRDRRAGYRYDLSILQAEFSLTQIWDQAVSGRCFFEEVIRENIDLGRPEQVQLIFSRKLNQSTVADGRCRTRIINEGVIPSLHIYYKNTHSKQYHKAAKRAPDYAPRRPLTTPMISVLAGVVHEHWRLWLVFCRPLLVTCWDALGYVVNTHEGLASNIPSLRPKSGKSLQSSDEQRLIDLNN